MTAKITRDIVESHLHCKFKAHLKLAGEQDSKCDYERLLMTCRDEVRLKAVERQENHLKERYTSMQQELTQALQTAGVQGAVSEGPEESSPES